MRIGVFDSGVGGLTIFKDIEKALPDYDYVYLGDNLRTPYGGRDAATVYEFTRQACEYLFKQECELIILACNTATASALRRLQSEWLPSLNDPHKRILGIIRPIAEAIPAQTKHGRIGVIGTKNTISSEAYDLELAEQFALQRSGFKYELFKQAAPLFVPLIEEGWLKNRVTSIVARQYLRALKYKHIDTLILACTHYPLLYNLIKNIMGPQVNVVLPGAIVASSLEKYLQRHPEIEILLDRHGERYFLTTGNTESFDQLSSAFLGYGVKSQQVKIV